jgi:hypothetical protein
VGGTEFMSTVHLRGADARSSSVERELLAAASVEERCALALRMLCELYGAPGGQLYLQREGGLAQVAGTSEFASGVAERATAYLEGELSTDAMLTQAFDEDEARKARAGQPPERLVLLTGSGDAGDVALGVLVLVPGPDEPDLTRVVRLSRTIGNALLRAGDARGVRTGRAESEPDDA